MHKFANCLKPVLCVFFIVIICCSCDRSYSEMNTELKSIMSEQYGIDMPESAKLIKGKYNEFLARDPYLEVVFEISAGDMYDTFSKRMWEASDITLALNGSVGTEVSIDWIYKDDDPKSHYYYADMLIEKTDDHLYKMSFCGYGVKTRYFEQ